MKTVVTIQQSATIFSDCLYLNVSKRANHSESQHNLTQLRLQWNKVESENNL